MNLKTSIGNDHRNYCGPHEERAAKVGNPIDMEPSYLRLWETGAFPERLTRSGTSCPLPVVPPGMRGGPPLRPNRVLRPGVQGPGGQGPAPFRRRAAADGNRGAGTVFFSGCALRCLYCQNYQISQEGLGEEMSAAALADIFLDLQQRGCHNLDLVSPTPHWPFILEALEIAIPRGLTLPIVYNTHGYLSLALAEIAGRHRGYLPAGYEIRDRRIGRTAFPGPRLYLLKPEGRSRNVRPDRPPENKSERAWPFGGCWSGTWCSRKSFRHLGRASGVVGNLPPYSAQSHGPIPACPPGLGSSPALLDR